MTGEKKKKILRNESESYPSEDRDKRGGEKWSAYNRDSSSHRHGERDDHEQHGIGTEASTCGDMYSYGILLLEMFTGRKRPTHDMFKDGPTLHHFTKMALPDQVLEVMDPLLQAGEYEEDNANSSRTPRRADIQETKMECLISILRVGIACSAESTKDRMDIADAAKELYSIRDKFLGTGIPTQR
ncbi:hypothetical protein CRYUN_Cryun03dG0150500 [Craigia yunnanensis]